MMLLLAAALAASAPPPAVVSALETAQLAEACKGKDSDSTATFCTGYIMGAFDTLSVAHQICLPPDGASTVETVAAARLYIRTHREAWDKAPSFVVRDALQEAFPCKAPEKKAEEKKAPVKKKTPARKAPAKQTKKK
jgi:hypothetical protein